MSTPVVITYTITAFLSEIGIKVSNQQIANMILARSYLPTLQQEHAVETLAAL